ncbi:hypothetical protein C5167_030892 [Papaver somniferum]|nr:hypothetical protein C5167_030892 [Papaver somniferum]
MSNSFGYFSVSNGCFSSSQISSSPRVFFMILHNRSSRMVLPAHILHPRLLFRLVAVCFIYPSFCEANDHSDLQILIALKDSLVIKRDLLPSWCNTEVHHVIGLSLEMLRELIPDKNRFTGSLPSTVGELGNLIELSVHGNSFSRNLPPGLKNLQKLVSVDLIMDLFSGNLPPSIGNLKRLIYLDASRNKFTGIIPQEL